MAIAIGRLFRTLSNTCIRICLLACVRTHSEEQKVAAEARCKAEEDKIKKKVVVEVLPAADFYVAENYHQNVSSHTYTHTHTHTHTHDKLLNARRRVPTSSTWPTAGDSASSNRWKKAARTTSGATARDAQANGTPSGRLELGSIYLLIDRSIHPSIDRRTDRCVKPSFHRRASADPSSSRSAVVSVPQGSSSCGAREDHWGVARGSPRPSI